MIIKNINMPTNVGVIILSKEQLVESTCHMRLDIEDNIGESVHVHYKNMRLDFTITDFLNLAAACSEALEELHSPSDMPPEIQPEKRTLLKSSNNIALNDNTPIKNYEIWENSGKNYFVIPHHNPWIDNKILIDAQVRQKIIEYTQKDNKIVEVYNIDNEKVVTKYYKDWYPFLIKSSNNWWGDETIKQRQQAYYSKFNTKKSAENFYNEVINEYRAFSSSTRCYFSDIFPNNILVNEDYSDFRIIDIGCLKLGKVQIPTFSQVITGDGANNLGFININHLNEIWK